MINNVSSHYDALIDENNDPVFDPEPLKKHMDRWDGSAFFAPRATFSGEERREKREENSTRFDRRKIVGLFMSPYSTIVLVVQPKYNYTVIVFFSKHDII